jgi:hypothetical protein
VCPAVAALDSIARLFCQGDGDTRSTSFSLSSRVIPLSFRERAIRARHRTTLSHADLQSISTIIASSNYFLPASTPAPASTIEKQLAELDLLVELLEPEQVKDLKDEVEKAGAGDGAKAALKGKVGTLGEKGEGKFTEFA